MAFFQSTYQKAGMYNLPRRDKLLIVIGQEPSHLAGVARPKDGKWYDLDLEKFRAGEISNKEAIRIREELKTVDSPYHKLIAKFQRKYKDDILVFDLSYYDLGKKHNLKSKSVHTFSDIINRNKEDRKKALGVDATNYTDLVDMMNACEHLLYIGEADNGLSFDLFLDEFDDVSVITNQSNKINIGVVNGGKIEDISHVKILDEISLENIENELSRITSRMKINELNAKEPITRDLDVLLAKWNSRVAKYDYRVIDPKLVENVKRVYPFIEPFPDVAVESIYRLYCKDTTRTSLAEKEVVREDFFVDMFLIYSLYDYSMPLEFLTARPKISFTKAYNEQNYRNIKRFLNIIKKNKLIDSAIS